VYAERHIRNLALIGFMGVGKSTMGRHFADFLNYRFVDTDEIIEQRQKTSIAQLFAERGEDYFRRLERDLVMEMKSWDHCVISTGGGLVTYEDNIDHLKQHAFVVCLWASPQTIFNRVKRQSHRPLLQTEDPLGTITNLLAKRKVFYQAADLMINTETRPMRQISQIVVRQFRQVQRRESGEGVD